MWPMLIMGAMSAFSAKKNNDNAIQQTQLDAANQRYSPWTRMGLSQTGEVHDPNTMGTLAQTYGAYQGQQQNNQRAASQQKLMDAQIAALNRYGYGGPNTKFTSSDPMMDNSQNASYSPWMASLNGN